MTIYTKTGDTGDTSLFGGGRVPKSSLRVSAYGNVDELNAAIGVTMAADPAGFEMELLGGIQQDLFAIGSQLASPDPDKVAKALEKASISESRVADLEATIDRLDEELPELTSFILPGGTSKAAKFHWTRVVCRRAERSVVELNRAEKLPPIVIVYLNRLSDLLFVLARLANHRVRVPDKEW